MQTLNRLCTTARTVLFTSIPALTQRVLPALVFTDAILQFQPNGSLEREVLVSSLLRLGYRKGSVVEIPGEFSIRGGIVDIYSTAYADPLRVEFLGDTIESIRFFDPATQKSTDKIKQAWVLPARELIRPEDAPDALAPWPPTPNGMPHRSTGPWTASSTISLSRRCSSWINPAR